MTCQHPGWHLVLCLLNYTGQQAGQMMRNRFGHLERAGLEALAIRNVACTGLPSSIGPAGVEGGNGEEVEEEEMPLDDEDAEEEDPIQSMLDTFWMQLAAESDIDLAKAGETSPPPPDDRRDLVTTDVDLAQETQPEQQPEDLQGAAAAAASSSQGVGRVLQGHDGKLAVDGGTISFYPSKNVFEAHCNNPLQGTCVLTRSGFGPATTARRRAKGAGRPLGLLSSWLAAGVACGSKAEHWQEEHTKPDYEIRLVSRLVLESLPGAGELLSHERPLEDEEDEEPRMQWDAPGQAH